ncbi:MAG TPA: hypothetical protein VF167_03600 [Longimicrobiaceae bacterium]
MANSSTALARTDNEDVTEEGRQQLQLIRQQGALAVEKAKLTRGIAKQLENMSWGSGYSLVKGEELPSGTRYAIAQLCAITGANPALHLYILGDRPYLNADYWAEKIAGQERFIRYEQFNLSLSHIEELRRLADEAAADGDQDDAIRLRREARDLAQRRSHFAPPEWATHVYETVIYRYSEAAPLAAIRRGEANASDWIEVVRECNWAGNKPKGKTAQGKEYDADPVGNAEPAKTARSRSLRRAAVKAFAVTLAPVEAELRKLENAIEADFEVLHDDQQQARAALPAAGEPQAARTGSGEPAAARAEGAEPLPTQELQPRRKPQLSPEARAERDKYVEGCRVLDIDPASPRLLEKIGGRTPETVEDFQALNAALAAIADGGDQ